MWTETFARIQDVKIYVNSISTCRRHSNRQESGSPSGFLKDPYLRKWEDSQK